MIYKLFQTVCCLFVISMPLLLPLNVAWAIEGVVDIDLSAGGQIIGTAALVGKVTDSTNASYYLDPAADPSLIVVGKVGIGTTAPGVKLEIANGVKETTLSTSSTLDIIGTEIASHATSTVQDILRLHQPNSAASFSKGSTFAVGLSFYEDPGANYPRTRVDFKTTGKTTDDADADNTVMSLLDSGNVGIGTTAPGDTLDVAGNITLNNYVSGEYGNIARSTDEWLRLNQNSGGTADHTNGIYTPGLFRADGGVQVDAYTAIDASNTWHYAVLSGTYDKFGKINASGFGIDANNNATYDLLVYDGGNLYTKQVYFGYGGAATIATYDTNEDLAIMPNGTGSVGIGTTAPASKLSVGGNGYSGYTIYGTNTATSGTSIYGYSTGSSSLGIYGQGTLQGVNGASAGTGVVGSGNVYDFDAQGAGVNYGATSSIRWKKDLTPINDALGKVLSMRGLYYTWDEAHGGGRDMGMIAEEVGQYVPEIVGWDADAPGFATGMDYGHLTPILVEAIKEQQTQIARLDSTQISSEARLVSLQSITTDFITQFKAGLIETKKLIVDGVDILKKLNELSVKVESQQRQIEELKKTVGELKLGR